MTAAYRKIGCCIDDSAAAAEAAGLARLLANGTGGQLLLVHVAPTPEAWLVGMDGWNSASLDAEQAIREQAGALLNEQAKKIDAEPVLLQGAHAGEAVCAWAADEGCDLLVAAPHSGRLRRTTVGSFAGYVSVHAPCSVLLARGTLPASASVPS